MDKTNIDTRRLALIGQITVTEERLATLKATLLHKPMGYDLVDDVFIDAMGNASLQVGAFIGQLGVYREGLR